MKATKNKALIRSTQSVANELMRATKWAVFDDYRTYSGASWGRGIYVYDLEGIDYEYQPLVRYPDLFLRFARLADNNGLDDELETEKNEAVAFEWVKSYGLLGGGAEASVAMRTRGGEPGDSLRGFTSEAWAAHHTLKSYEAATRPNGPDVESLVKLTSEQDRDLILNSAQETVREWALWQVRLIIQSEIAGGVYPQVYRLADGSCMQGLGFNSLLSAMWIQMFWLAAADHVRRCKNQECSRVVSFEQPQQQAHPELRRSSRGGRYATREGKEFCSATCRYSYHHLTVRKPKRQAKKTR